MTFLQTFQRFLSPVIYDKKPFVQGAMEGILDGMYAVSTLYFFEKVSISIHSGDIHIFYASLLYYAISMSVYIGIKIYIIHWGWVNLYRSIDTFCANTYLPKFIYCDPNISEKIGTGKFISIYTRGKDTWMKVYHDFLSTDLALIVASIYGIWRIGMYNIWYSLGVVCILVLLVLCTYAIDRHYTIPARNKRREIELEYSRWLARIFMSKMEYLQNKEFANEQKRIYKHLDDICTQNYTIDTSVGGMFIGLRGISFFLRISVYILVGIGIYSSTATYYDFSLYTLIVGMLELTLRTVYDTFRKFTREFDYIQNFWSTFDSLSPIHGYDTGTTYAPKNTDIHIDHIRYGYGGEYVFDDLSLSIYRWKKTALVGASGGWKTTLLKLLAGYLHPHSGSISVCGNVLADTALRTYYPHIGYLSQDPGVFDATIRENLLSAISHISPVSSDTTHIASSNNTSSAMSSRAWPEISSPTYDTDIENVLKNALDMAQCQFVYDLEKWIDTEIWERWVRLSGGQKQRLAIAKIFLKNPDIILLDEPTSALDSFSEEAITKALDILFQNRTVIIVAHRLQTVRRADDILVLHAGQVVERGTHTQLVEKNGIYNKMLELQSGF